MDKVTVAMSAGVAQQGKVETMERTITKMDDRLTTIERDYTSNITTRLARLEASNGKGN
jgi:hypothetical protein